MRAQSSGDTTALRIGTRGSPLALAQAQRGARRASPPRTGSTPSGSSIEVIRTTGDTIHDRPLAEAGGKGLFTKEIEEALLAGAIDLAVHSAKDMPTVLPAGLAIAAVSAARRRARRLHQPPRPRRCASCRTAPTVGTASLRRQALVQRLRPDLRSCRLRGNVETRLRKLDAGEVDATLLALAGLKRLGLADAATAIMRVEEFLPAVGQGAIAIEARADDDRDTLRCSRAINHAETATALAPSAPSSPCSTAPAARRSPAMPPSPADCAFPRPDRQARRQRGARDRAQREPSRDAARSAPMPAAS